MTSELVLDLARTVFCFFLLLFFFSEKLRFNSFFHIDFRLGLGLYLDCIFSSRVKTSFVFSKYDWAYPEHTEHTLKKNKYPISKSRSAKKSSPIHWNDPWKYKDHEKYRPLYLNEPWKYKYQKKYRPLCFPFVDPMPLGWPQKRGEPGICEIISLSALMK